MCDAFMTFYQYTGIMSVHILAVDDEPLSLTGLVESIQATVPQAHVHPYSEGMGAAECARQHLIDVAFIDINLGITSGITLAQDLAKINPQTNIIFVTGYSDYKGEAMDMHASGYIMKPVTEEKVLQELKHLRHPLPDAQKQEPLYIQTFGEFEVFSARVPLAFHYAKTKELFAILVDRHGAFCTNNLIVSLLWEDATLKEKNSYLRNLRMDLYKTLSRYEQTDIILQHRGEMAIDISKIRCDYYDWLDGKIQLEAVYYGEYMAQYSWAEQTNGFLYNTSLKTVPPPMTDHFSSFKKAKRNDFLDDSSADMLLRG